ncbi:hypothetical protein [Candidatus Amarolinea aalborgensis]|uniref:hypothetical protein n=1 Tax=Candidatus Amarolinea aalborgensis TaxID=2249329 RepID=UPI003BF96B47
MAARRAAKWRAPPPPVTSPAWKCYAAGKYAGKLGVFWWQQLIPTRVVIIPPRTPSRAPKCGTISTRAGLRTGVIGVPRTYPPKALDGFAVCAALMSARPATPPARNWRPTWSRLLDYELNIKGDFFNATKDSPVVQKRYCRH